MPNTNTTSKDPRANLTTLASQLEALPADYAQFEMACFLDFEDDEKTRNYLLNNGGVSSCGTSACAVGHGPSAGLFFLPDEIMVNFGEIQPNWMTYTRRVFGIHRYSDEFSFLFGGAWADYDNTVHGAAARIRYYLDNGLPDYDQRYNYDPSIYQEYLVS